MSAANAQRAATVHVQPHSDADLAIVVTDFNGWERTRLCLQALAESHFQSFDIFVVDHGTTDTTAKGLAANFPHVHRVPASAELWWAGASNVGIQVALKREATRIVLLNNDCYVSKNALATLMEHSQAHPEWIIAAVQVDLDSGQHIAITPSQNLLLGFATLNGPKSITDKMRAERLVSTNLIGGGRGVIIPAHVFLRVGLFDDADLPHYYADHDFYLRCRAAGIVMKVAVDATVAIDQTQTSIANAPSTMSFRGLVASFTSMRSHRSIRHLAPFFKHHYPIPGLWPIGVALYVVRYLTVYAARRIYRAARLARS
jgi:GT2 family glycosyltransferase